MTYLDLLQVYNLKNGNDVNDVVSIFDDIDIDNRIDKQTLALSILDECGAMRCIYDTTYTFKIFSDNFFKKYKDNITRILNVLEIQYNPLESINFDWTEKTDISQNLDTDENIEENRNKLNTGTQTKTDTETATKTDTEDTTITNTEASRTTDTEASTTTDTKGTATTTTEAATKTNTGTKEITNSGTQTDSGSGTETNTISAMNENTYQPDSHKDTTSGNTRTNDLTEEQTDNLSEQKNGTVTEQKSGSDTEQKTGTSTEEKSGNSTQAKNGSIIEELSDNLVEETVDNKQETIDANNNRTKTEELVWDELDKHTEKGSKGFAYQDLIQKEINIRNFSIYGWITKKYANELFLLVY